MPHLSEEQMDEIRGIDLLTYLKGCEPHHNCIFIGFDEDDEARYAFYRGTTRERVMGEASGYDKRYCFRLGDNTETIHVFEGVLDLLSYTTISKMSGEDWKNETLISLGGVYAPSHGIGFVNGAFQKRKKIVAVIGGILNQLPNTYRIVEKWNIKDHEERVKDGSITYDRFDVQPGRIEYCISGCMYVNMFEYYGIRKLCKIICMTDTNAYDRLTKHVKFVRYSDLSDGDSCHLYIQKLRRTKIISKKTNPKRRSLKKRKPKRKMNQKCLQISRQ